MWVQNTKHFRIELSSEVVLSKGKVNARSKLETKFDPLIPFMWKNIKFKTSNWKKFTAYYDKKIRILKCFQLQTKVPISLNSLSSLSIFDGKGGRLFNTHVDLLFYFILFF